MAQNISPGEGLAQPAPDRPLLPVFSAEKQTYLDEKVLTILNGLNIRAKDRMRVVLQIDDEYVNIDQLGIVAGNFPDVGVVQMLPYPRPEDETNPLKWNAVQVKFLENQMEGAYVLAKVMAREVLMSRSHKELRGQEDDNFDAVIFFDMSFPGVHGHGDQMEGFESLDKTNFVIPSYKYSNGRDMAKLTYLYLKQIEDEFRATGEIPADEEPILERVKWVSASATARTEIEVKHLDTVAEVDAPEFEFHEFYEKYGFVQRVTHELRNPQRHK